MPNGAFVTFEGGEGAGKTLQRDKLAAWLTYGGDAVVATREPGGSEHGEAIRALLLEPGSPWSPVAQTFLMAAARREHVRETIAPARQQGVWVISDRFHDSTAAYQGAGDGVGKELIDNVAAAAVDGWFPDLTLILDIAPDRGLARARDRGDANVYEGRELGYHQRVRDCFRKLALEQPDRCVVIDAGADPDTVHEQVVSVVRARLASQLPPSLRS